MKNCPVCNTAVDGLVCPKCSPANPKPAANDPDRYRCADVMRGLRCSNLGTMSHSTTGSGPWLCSQHFLRQAPPDRRGPPGGFRELHKILRQVDPESAAERAAIAADGREAT